MGDRHYYPDDWRDYCQSCKAENGQPDRSWAIFAARFRVAGNFYGGTWFGMKEGKVTQGYDVAMRLLLSYSALESACNATGLKPVQVCLIYPGSYLDECRQKIRSSFRVYSEEDFPLRQALNSARLQRKLDDFFDGGDDDLMPFASAMRHLFAHGFWTPTGSDALTKTAIDGLDLLHQGLLLAGQEMFNNFWQGYLKK